MPPVKASSSNGWMCPEEVKRSYLMIRSSSTATFVVEAGDTHQPRVKCSYLPMDDLVVQFVRFARDCVVPLQNVNVAAGIGALQSKECSRVGRRLLFESPHRCVFRRHLAPKRWRWELHRALRVLNSYHPCVTRCHAQVVEVLFVPDCIVVNLAAKRTNSSNQGEKDIY